MVSAGSEDSHPSRVVANKRLPNRIRVDSSGRNGAYTSSSFVSFVLETAITPVGLLLSSSIASDLFDNRRSSTSCSDEEDELDEVNVSLFEIPIVTATFPPMDFIRCAIAAVVEVVIVEVDSSCPRFSIHLGTPKSNLSRTDRYCHSSTAGLQTRIAAIDERNLITLLP